MPEPLDDEDDADLLDDDDELDAADLDDDDDEDEAADDDLDDDDVHDEDDDEPLTAAPSVAGTAPSLRPAPRPADPADPADDDDDDDDDVVGPTAQHQELELFEEPAFEDSEFDDVDFDDVDFDDDEEAERIYDEGPLIRRRPGFIMSGLLGVEEALYGVRRNQIVMVADADGMPEPDFEINLTPDPRDATVILRKHRR